MDFYTALRFMMESGASVSRGEWGDVEYYGLIRDGLLMLHKPDGKFHQWIVSDGDISASDWMIVGEFVNA